MSAIITSKSGNHTYLYETESYREDGKVKNQRRIIGKVDPATGMHIYKPEYIREKGLHMKEETASDVDIYSVTDVKQSVVKEYGAFFLLDEISKKTGLTTILAETMPDNYEDILNLAFFMVSTGEPAMYCEDWLYKAEHYPGRALSSQRISELLTHLSNGERMNFFERWGEFGCENEFVALDITSISTYSELINDAEWGYNRDKEKLPQVNICMLMGEKSKLPILQVVYSGSLTDVSTLKTTLKTASGLELNGLSLVMDKGFAKIDNINAMMSKTSGNRFVIALPFTMGFAKEQVKREADGIDCAENTVLIGNDVLRGSTSNQAWNGDYGVFVHACFCPETFVYAKNNLYAKVNELIAQVRKEPEKHRNRAEVKKYLTIRKSKKSDIGYSIKIKSQMLTKELLTTGWVIIISNYVDNVQEALQIYRGKDVVEKGFLRMKSCLDLARLRVHSNEVMQNKIFIGFIALIITAHIHKVMAENQLYKSWSMKKMIKTLERLKVHHIKGDRIVSPLTKDQKRIFSAFDLKSVL